MKGLCVNGLLLMRDKKRVTYTEGNMKTQKHFKIIKLHNSTSPTPLSTPTLITIGLISFIYMTLRYCSN